MIYAAVGRRAEAVGLALRGGFQVAEGDGVAAATVLMLGLLMNQNRQVNVFVRRPFW